MPAFINVVITSATTIHFPDIDSLPVIFQSLALMLALRRDCDERSDEAIPRCLRDTGLLRGACHGAARSLPSGAHSRDPFRNDGDRSACGWGTRVIAQFRSPSRKVHALHAGSLRAHAQRMSSRNRHLQFRVAASSLFWRKNRQDVLLPDGHT